MRASKSLSVAMASLIILSSPWTIPLDSASATTGCTAGTATTNTTGNVVVVRFNAPATGDGDCTFTVPDGVFVVDYLVVAGGGGGGSGGGGGGGVVFSDNPQSVEPGQSIDVTVGAGGAGGMGGIASDGTFPTDGSDSSFGTVEAAGGGAGGSWNRFAAVQGSPNGATGGSSGGDAYDAQSQAGQTNQGTVIVGATSLGSPGGASSGGGYSAGGGGGGATATGQNSRRPATAPEFAALNGCQAWTDCTNFFYGGGAGGAGHESNISGQTRQYGCGGGGGINSNSNQVVANAGGPAGCDTAGRGSSFGFTGASVNTADNATDAAAGFGGGGGGTDPEDVLGGDGGSGVVIVRYTIVDNNCPNDGTRTATAPLACPTELTISGDGSSTSLVVRGSPVSFSGQGATLSVRSFPRANPTSGNMSVSASGDSLTISVPSGSSLVGGTYPVVYRITQGTTTSDSYVLVTVEDPGQLTPGVIPLDPREDSITVPRIELGAAPNVRLCLTLPANVTNLTWSAAATTGVTITSSTTRLVLTGTNANVESAMGGIGLAAGSGQRLLPNTNNLDIDVNVGNTNNGGNGSCTFGTSSTIELRNLQFSTGQHLIIRLD